MVDDKDLGWLAGFFDGEGCVSHSTAYYKGKKRTSVYFSITNTDRNLIEKAQVLLDNLEIDSTLRGCDSGRPNSQLVYRLCISNRVGIRRFFEKVPVQSKAKLLKYQELQPLLSNRSKDNTSSRHKRLARQNPELL